MKFDLIISETDITKSAFASKYKTEFLRLNEIQQLTDDLYTNGIKSYGIAKSDYTAWNTTILNLIDERNEIQKKLSTEAKNFSDLGNELLNFAQSNFNRDDIKYIF